MLAKIKSTAKPHHVFAVVFCIIVLAWSGYPYFLLWLFSPDATLEKLGPFGDLYGGLNTLFSGMALLGLGLNIYMQGVQIQKLEKKEQENEDQLKAQVEMLRDSTLLSYYTDEIRRLSDGIEEVRQLKVRTPEMQEEKEILKNDLMINLAEIRIKRNKLIKKLSPDTDLDDPVSGE